MAGRSLMPVFFVSRHRERFVRRCISISNPQALSLALLVRRIQPLAMFAALEGCQQACPWPTSQSGKGPGQKIVSLTNGPGSAHPTAAASRYRSVKCTSERDDGEESKRPPIQIPSNLISLSCCGEGKKEHAAPRRMVVTFLLHPFDDLSAPMRAR